MGRATRGCAVRPTPITRVEAEVGGGRLVVVPDADNPGAATVWVDGVPQSYVDLGDPTHLSFEYVRQIGDVVDVELADHGALRALHLGGGGLTIPRYVHATHPGSVQRVVELDAQLVEHVRTALPLPDRHRITITTDDARAYLDRCRPPYDLVVVDVFAGGRVPAGLLTVEAATRLAAVLATDGVAITNLVDGRPLAYARSVAATALAAFTHVVVVGEPSVWRGRRVGNLLLLAAHRPLDEGALARRLSGGMWPARVVAGDDLRRFVAGARPLHDVDAVASPQLAHGVFDALRPPERDG